MHVLIIVLSLIMSMKSSGNRGSCDEKHPVEFEKPPTRIHSGRVWLKEPSHYSSYLLTVINSSAGTNCVLFETDGLSVARINSNSYLLIRHCRIEINERNSSSGFLCDGEIVIEGLEIHSEYKVKSLIESNGEEEEGISEISSTTTSSTSPLTSKSRCRGTVSIKRSKMEDIEVYRSGGGIISGRGIVREGVIGCSFVNVSSGIEDRMQSLLHGVQRRR